MNKRARERTRWKILVFNPGSASLKFDIIEDSPGTTDVVTGRKLVSGVIEPIGGPATLSLIRSREAIPYEEVLATNHGTAALRVLGLINKGAMSSHGVTSAQDLDAVAYRVVHGGELYLAPVQIDEHVISAIETLEDLAPLHNAGSVSVIRASRAILPPEIPAVAVFDTAFHQTIPEHARLYAIPWEFTKRYKIRRYGFHGISHKYLLLRYSELTGTPMERADIITLHLEGGSSATAIKGGQSIDTSMGFTPLEGLVMGTRCGDLDPAVVAFLARKEQVDTARVEDWLNTKSGLLGISGISQDTRILAQFATREERARIALEIFAYRVRKYVGAYLAATGGAAALVFGGGIGENTPSVRRQICEGLECFGLDFDPDRNGSVIDREDIITRDGSRLQAWVIPTEEALMIAHEAMRCCLEQRISAV